MLPTIVITAAIGSFTFGLAPTASAQPRLFGVTAAQTGWSLSPEIPASPGSQRNAIRAAQDYLAMSAYSRQGLIEQLVVGDGYSTQDATFAVDSLNVDWNQQAVKSAQQYLEMSAYSRKGLVEQLVVGEGFTSSQAAYGVSVAYD